MTPAATGMFRRQVRSHVVHMLVMDRRLQSAAISTANRGHPPTHNAYRR